MSAGTSMCTGLCGEATGNAAAVRALPTKLVERGSLLTVIDGGKAPHNALVVVFGVRARIQALPRLCASVRSAMNQIYAVRDPGRARRLLQNLARRLEHQHPGTAPPESLDETQTVMRLRLPANL